MEIQYLAAAGVLPSQIGHTFFAEVADLYYRYQQIEGNRDRFKHPLYGTGKPAKTLWDISLEPIIHAFLGNLDLSRREEIMTTLPSDELPICYFNNRSRSWWAGRMVGSAGFEYIGQRYHFVVTPRFGSGFPA